jgi:DNA-binding response OmpR family regulator
MQDMSKKILLVDDSKMVLMMEEMILGTKQNYTLISAKDGHEAVEKAVAESPDLVLMDVVMPRMNGFQACKRLRDNEATCGIPVILVTTKGQEEDVEAGFEHGCCDYLTKPIHEHELINMVEAYLGE